MSRDGFGGTEDLRENGDAEFLDEPAVLRHQFRAGRRKIERACDSFGISVPAFANGLQEPFVVGRPKACPFEPFSDGMEVARIFREMDGRRIRQVAQRRQPADLFRQIGGRFGKEIAFLVDCRKKLGGLLVDLFAKRSQVSCQFAHSGDDGGGELDWFFG